MATKKKPATETAAKDGGAEPAAETVTVEEARAMFDERPDLASVLTDEGRLNRDGSFAGGRTLGLDGIYR